MKSLLILFLFSIYASLVFAQDLDNTLSGYLQKAQYPEAIEYINQQEPAKELLFQKAFCYQSLNDYSQAIEILQSLSETYPDDIPVKLQLAMCYESDFRFLKSVDCYEELVKIDSTNIYFQVRKADMLYRAEKYLSARDEYLKINPKYNPAYLNRSIALCYDKINQPDSAKVYFAQAWKLNPKDSFSALNLVKIYIKKEDFHSALTDSEAYIFQDSSNVQMNILHAYSYYNLSIYELAVKEFEKCRTQGDSSLIVNRSLGISHYFLKNDSLALLYLNQAYSQDTTNMNMLYALASVNYNLGYFSEAIKYYSTLVKRASPDRNALFIYFKGLGQSYEKNGIFDEAVKNYISATHYIPSNEQSMELYYALSMLCERELQNYDWAVNYYTQYRLSLFNYQNTLEDSKKIEEIELKIVELDKHIQSLKELRTKN